MDELSSREKLAYLISSRLGSRTRKKIFVEKLKPAAVLIPVSFIEERPQIILTKRSMNVQHHKGEISFPGGHAESDDASPVETALREAEEEIGIRSGDVDILGLLDDYITISGFHITPAVGIVPWPYELKINSESETLLFLPLADVLSDDAWMMEKASIKGHEFELFCLETEDGVIWGATAKMLRQFAEVLLEREPATKPVTETARKWILSVIASQEAYR
ncbi:MAG TPA: CoA pyrophosphatase [Desulfomonilia bacterium]